MWGFSRPMRHYFLNWIEVNVALVLRISINGIFYYQKEPKNLKQNTMDNAGEDHILRKAELNEIFQVT